jgi:hypothetical protein
MACSTARMRARAPSTRQGILREVRRTARNGPVQSCAAMRSLALAVRARFARVRALALLACEGSASPRRAGRATRGSAGLASQARGTISSDHRSIPPVAKRARTAIEGSARTASAREPPHGEAKPSRRTASDASARTARRSRALARERREPRTASDASALLESECRHRD